MLPHRDVAGRETDEKGLNALEMSNQFRKAYLLLNLEPESDVQRPYQFRKALANADMVVALTPFVTESLKTDADVLLPIGSFAESAGTYVNCEGIWQSIEGVASPLGEARPAWKILRVLGNLFDLGGFEFNTAFEVRDALKAKLGGLDISTKYRGSANLNLAPEAPHAYLDMPVYGNDSIVRRSTALQDTRAAKEAGNQFFKAAIV